MQERYLGDSHDFAKYALLLHLKKALGLRLGLNWYLTDSARVDKVGNNDGEKRHHFNVRRWDGWEEELLQKLSFLQFTADRRLTNFYALNVLPPDTVYVDDHVPELDRPSWHRSALDALAATDLVFMDPDNGLQVPSMSRRTQPKYALYSEARDYFAAGKIVVVIQFARQCNPLTRAASVRQSLSQHFDQQISVPIVRARLSPNLLFLTAAPAHLQSEVTAAIKAFANGREKIELIL